MKEIIIVFGIVSAIALTAILVSNKSCAGDNDMCCIKSPDGNTICLEGPCPKRKRR